MSPGSGPFMVWAVHRYETRLNLIHQRASRSLLLLHLAVRNEPSPISGHPESQIAE